MLILDASDCPAADGSSGVTSSHAVDDAEAADRTIQVGSNFFLFFKSRPSSTVGMKRRNETGDRSDAYHRVGEPIALRH